MQNKSNVFINNAGFVNKSIVSHKYILCHVDQIFGTSEPINQLNNTKMEDEKLFKYQDK